jgi:hypothetical protein
MADPDDELDINLRVPKEVAARILILAAVCRRAFLETLARAGDRAAAEEARFDLPAWLREEGLDWAISPLERRLLETRIGRLPADEVAAASWRAEAIVALMWAARHPSVPAMPAYDASTDLAPMIEAIPTPWDATASFTSAIRLRPEDEIATERERAELWHWRAEVASELAAAAGAERTELLTVIRGVAEEAAAAGLLPPPVGGDFPANGRSYRSLDDDQQAIVASLAFERLYALNWLCGFGPDWDDVPIDI